MKSIYRAMIRYQATNTIKSALGYYVIMCSIVIGLEVLLKLLASTGNVLLNNLEFNTSIFLFVMGLNILKQDLKFYSANGLTRKQLFASVMVNACILSAFMMVMDTLLGFIYGSVSNYVPFSKGLYQMIYAGQPAILAFVFLWAYYVCVFLIGFFVSNVYYKLNAAGKVIVSVGVPCFLIPGLSYIDATFFNLTLLTSIASGFLTIMGIQPVVNPIYGILTLLVSATVLSIASFGLMRRAILKDA